MNKNWRNAAKINKQRIYSGSKLSAPEESCSEITTKEDLNRILIRILKKSAEYFASLASLGNAKVLEGKNLSGREKEGELNIEFQTQKLLKKFEKMNENLVKNCSENRFKSHENEGDTIKEKEKLLKELKNDNDFLSEKLAEAQPKKTELNSETLYVKFKSDLSEIKDEILINKEKLEGIRNRRERLENGVRFLERKLEDEVEFLLNKS